MLLPPRRIAGAISFAASIAASTNVSGYFSPTLPKAREAFVREFQIPTGELKPQPMALLRGFTLEGSKQEWRPEQDLAEDVLFENELNPTGPDGEALVTGLEDTKVEVLDEKEVVEPQGHFFLDRYLPLEGDTLRKAATRLGCIPEMLSLLNGGKALDKKLDSSRSIHIYRGPVTAHSIQQGDTLWSISRSYRIPLRELIWLNRLRSLDIHAGNTVFIARGVVSKNVEQRAATDLVTSELLAKAKQRMQGGKEASASAMKGIRVTRPVSGSITSGFGWRRHPFLKRTSFHKGVDIAARAGTPIRALYGGKIVFAGHTKIGGNSIIIRHPNKLYTSYAHLSIINVSKGDEIPQGTTIGKVGKTGQATAPHLHFAMRRGPSALDPLPFLR